MVHRFFEKIADVSSEYFGKPSAFIIAMCICLVWLVSGPFFNYSDTWQLVINTGTTVITFLMIFLVQSSQNRDTKAIQAKLDKIMTDEPHISEELVGDDKKD